MPPLRLTILNLSTLVDIITRMATEKQGLETHLRDASTSLSTASAKLRLAFVDAGTDEKAKKKAYDLDLLSHEALDLYDRVLSIMHTLDIRHK